MEKKRLITSALPYVNNIPHLGNLIQVLSADVFARYCRNRGYETFYVCGTDEYGTATETRALEQGVTPKELCDHFHKIHKEIYEWFNIDFDYFGRTSNEVHTKIVQDIFLKAYQNGFIIEKKSTQLFCEKCDRFLADRYILGTCPHCNYTDARGDQCEACGKLLDPTELKSPRCSSCGSTPIPKETSHLYIDLPKVLPMLEAWIEEASVNGFWSANAIAMTKSWIRDGLKERCITRDLKWGIPVPLPEFQNKVFYVWFDAPIGYISMSADKNPAWQDWWKNPSDVELFQFIGKDNIPFHTVIFPSSLLATKEKWTMLHHMSATEYLNYEDGKFSKSKGTGVFGTDAKETGIPADVWRFYIFYNRPEKTDVLFTWKDFAEKINGELIGNFSNLVNRTLSFVTRFYGGKVPEGKIDFELRAKIDAAIQKIDSLFDKADLRDALHETLALSDICNKAFQSAEPWKARTENPEIAASIIRTLVFAIRDLAILLLPFIPSTSKKIASFFGDCSLNWSELGKESFDTVVKSEILFTNLDDKLISTLREKYKGSQSQRSATTDNQVAEEKAESSKRIENRVAAKVDESLPLPQRFASSVILKVGKIISIEQHPQADKLYVENIDLGAGDVRQIVSGLVDFYSKEELLNKKVIVVENLKPSKIRGIESAGMVLAATKTHNDNSILEVLTVASEVEVGRKIEVEGCNCVESKNLIKIDAFFDMPLTVENGIATIDGKKLLCGGSEIKISKISTGVIG